MWARESIGRGFNPRSRLAALTAACCAPCLERMSGTTRSGKSFASPQAKAAEAKEADDKAAFDARATHMSVCVSDGAYDATHTDKEGIRTTRLMKDVIAAAKAAFEQKYGRSPGKELWGDWRASAEGEDVVVSEEVLATWTVADVETGYIRLGPKPPGGHFRKKVLTRPPRPCMRTAWPPKCGDFVTEGEIKSCNCELVSL